MPRGGRREGAGRKKEYLEPVKKILIGLPESALKQLDDYAEKKGLSRPKAVMQLLKQVELKNTAPKAKVQPATVKKKPKAKRKAFMLDELKSLLSK